MASNFNRGNGSMSNRSKINIERNDLTDNQCPEDGFAMPDPEDDFWKPVVPGKLSPADEKTDEYDSGAGKIASACAKIQLSDRELHSSSPRFKPSKPYDHDYLAEDSHFGRGYDRDTSLTRRRRNPSPAADADLLSFDEPNLRSLIPNPFLVHGPNPAPPASNPRHYSSEAQRDFDFEPGIISPEDSAVGASASTSSFDVLEGSKKMLYEMFCHVPPKRIDEILKECNGSVTLCTDLLLEYPEPSYTMDSRPAQNNLFRKVNKENEFRSDLPSNGGQKKRSRNYSGPSATVVSGYAEPSEFGGIFPSSMRHSRTNYTLNTADVDTPDICVAGSSGKPQTKTTASSPESDIYGTLDDPDLFVPIDGEDWFDFQLTPDFVRDLFNAYSEPERLSEAEMIPDSPELKIRIPPKLAFKLYQMLALNMMQKSIDQERVNNVATDEFLESESFDDPPSIGRGSGLPVSTTQQPVSDIEIFVKEEAKLSLRELHTIRHRRDQIQNEMALKLTVAKLKAVFPTVPDAVLEEAFSRSGRQFDETVVYINSVHGCVLDPKGVDDEFIGSEVIIADAVKQEVAELTALSAKLGVEDWDGSNLTAEDWRNMATKHHVLRNQYQTKGQLVAKHGLAGALAYYSKIFNLHTDRMLEANRKAALIIMHEFERRNGNENILDLHHLFVAEAIDALHNRLAECAKTMQDRGMTRMEIRVITGRGNRSANGVPRIAPAVVAYLQSHHYSFLQLNGSIVVTLKQSQRPFQY